jgi:hypothetical protein
MEARDMAWAELRCLEAAQICLSKRHAVESFKREGVSVRISLRYRLPFRTNKKVHRKPNSDIPRKDCESFSKDIKKPTGTNGQRAEREHMLHAKIVSICRA